MRVPRELLSTVVFLGQTTTLGKQLAGTAFFISAPAGADDETTFAYLATAGHCVEEKSGLFARLNDPAGGTQDLDLPDGDHWRLYPDGMGEDKVDLAVIPWPPEAQGRALQAGYRWVPRSMCFSEEMLSDSPTEGLGIGDDVVAVGLFTIHAGQDKNATVVRRGHLAMVPTERVWVDEYKAEMALYLVELNATGGMSGAPIFGVHRALIGKPSVISLLGVWIGHWSVNERGERVHSGVGMVTPARMLATILDEPDWAQERRRAAQEIRMKAPTIVLDAAERGTASGDEFFRDPKGAALRTRASEAHGLDNKGS